MSKKCTIKPEWLRERLLRKVSGKLRVNVYVLHGYGGAVIYQVKCSDPLVRERQFRTETPAREYAERIIEFDKRQLSLDVKP